MQEFHIAKYESSTSNKLSIKVQESTPSNKMQESSPLYKIQDSSPSNKMQKSSPLYN